MFLHPAAERQLSSFIREHSEHSYIIATHSPLLINTLDPVWLWLVSRDERGTLIRPIYQSIQGRQLLFSELGIKSGEVAIADRILFVEDDSDCDIYKILLGKLGYDENRYNYHAIGLTGAGVTKPFRQIVSALNTVFNIKHLFFLDGDQRGNFLQDPCIRFLPEPEIEDLLLRDMDAVCPIFKDAIMAQAPDNGNDTIADWTPEKIKQFVEQRRKEKPQDKGSKILIDLTHAIGIQYHKGRFNKDIAQLLGVEFIADLAAEFKDFCR